MSVASSLDWNLLGEKKKKNPDFLQILNEIPTAASLDRNMVGIKL